MVSMYYTALRGPSNVKETCFVSASYVLRIQIISVFFQSYLIVNIILFNIRIT